MKVVIDTNVLFSALYRPESAPGQILLLGAEGALQLYAPESVRRELEAVLRGKLRYADEEWAATVASLPVEWVEEALYEPFLARARRAVRDPADAPVVALALALRADVVSGDRAFHPLQRKVVRTWKPRDAAERRAKRGRRKR